MKLPNYEILLVEEHDTYKKQVIKFENGTTVSMHIPKHTPEEEKELAAKITKAMFELCFPDENWDGKNLMVIQ